MNKSESIASLAASLAKAQAEIEKADKDKTNPHFRSKYADLGNVVDAIKPALIKNSLTFTQICHEAENAAKVETIILHSSGEWLSCGCISVPVSKADAQGFGSALTYARRYSLSAAFGVAPEDDDGNAAAKAAPQKQEPPKEQAPKPELSEAQVKLGSELSEYCKHDPEMMAKTLKDISYYKTGDKEGHLKVEDIAKPNSGEKFQRWIGASLGKLRELTKKGE